MIRNFPSFSLCVCMVKNEKNPIHRSKESVQLSRNLFNFNQRLVSNLSQIESNQKKKGKERLTSTITGPATIVSSDTLSLQLLNKK